MKTIAALIATAALTAPAFAGGPIAVAEEPVIVPAAEPYVAPGLDWTDINTVADQLAALGIEPPASLIEGIFLDQCFNAGNRVGQHHVDQPPIVLHAG